VAEFAPPLPLTIERVRAAQSVLCQVVPESRLAGTVKLSKHGGVGSTSNWNAKARQAPSKCAARIMRSTHVRNKWTASCEAL
jgi:hypothetical protein